MSPIGEVLQSRLVPTYLPHLEDVHEGGQLQLMEIFLVTLFVLWVVSKLDLGNLFGGLLSWSGSQGRRRPFKTRYSLTQRQPISEFEDKMARGMLREGKEVWVTAFCAEGEAITATATIGSWGKCEPSDNVMRWSEKCQRLGAKEIRWYHNHQKGLGKSFPSREDKKTHRKLKSLLEPSGIRFRSFLVYPSLFFSYRIKEFGR